MQGQQCPLCKKFFSDNRVTVDGDVAKKFYTHIAAIIKQKSVPLTKSTAFRIGGKNPNRYRQITTGYAIEYCRIIHNRFPDPECVVASSDIKIPIQDNIPNGEPLFITRPNDGSNVGPYTAVSGGMSGSSLQNEGKIVWVLIKPDGDYFWVQRPARVSRNKWRSETRFGDPYTENGHHFLVYAIVDAKVELKVAQKLRSLPTASLISSAVEVVLDRGQT